MEVGKDQGFEFRLRPVAMDGNERPEARIRLAVNNDAFLATVQDHRCPGRIHPHHLFETALRHAWLAR